MSEWHSSWVILYFGPKSHSFCWHPLAYGAQIHFGWTGNQLLWLQYGLDSLKFLWITNKDIFCRMVPYLDHYCHCGEEGDAVKHWFPRSQTREIAVKTSLLQTCSFTIFICLTRHGLAFIHARHFLLNALSSESSDTTFSLFSSSWSVTRLWVCFSVCVCLQSAYVLLHRKFAADWYPCSLRSPCPPQTRY